MRSAGLVKTLSVWASYPELVALTEKVLFQPGKALSDHCSDADVLSEFP